MPEGAYELGIDIGTSSAVAATCRLEPGGDSSSSATFRVALTSALAAWSTGRTLDDADDADLAPYPTQLLERLGDPAPVRVGERTAAAADVVAGLITLLIDHVTVQEGTAPGGTAVAVPPSWGSHRRTALLAALRAAGLEDTILVSAAIAAVRARVDSGELPADATAVVVDIGAATTDIAVVGPREDGELGHRAAPPAALSWGGQDVDDVVLRHVRRCLDLPADLSTPADRARALSLRAACRTAKEAASLETEVTVNVDPTWSDAPVRLTREELEDAVADGVEPVVATTVDAVEAARTPAGGLSAVVLTGGASRMPLVAEQLSAALGVPVYAAADPALTSAVGAARIAADLRPATEDVDGNTEAATEAVSGSRRRTGRNLGKPSPSRPGPTARSSVRPRRTAPGGRSGRTPASRMGIVATLFLLLVVGPSIALALVGAGPGAAVDGTAAAGDQTASAPTRTGEGAAALPGASADGTAATSNAGHRVPAPSTTGSSRHTTGTSTTSSGGSSTATATSSSLAVAAAATADPGTATAPTTATATSPATTADTTTPGTTSTDPPTSSAPEPPPTTTEAPAPPPPPPTSSAPAPVPDPSTSGGSTGTATDTGTPVSSTPDSPPVADSTGATA